MDDDSQKPKANLLLLLSLPPELRLLIYHNALVSPRQITIPYHDSHLAPSLLLLANKQISHEATPILYSQNTFLLAEPKCNLKWLDQIGPANIQHLKRLQIFPHAVYSTQTIERLGMQADAPLWYELLGKLARGGITRLQYLEVYWDAATDMGHVGAGRDVRFVRELAAIGAVEGKMVIGGCYGVHWPAYSAEKMGVTVQVDEDPRWQEWLREYQRGQRICDLSCWCM